MSLARQRADSLFGEGYLVKQIRCLDSAPRAPDPKDPFAWLSACVANASDEARRLVLLYHEDAKDKLDATALVVVIDLAVALVTIPALWVLWVWFGARHPSDPRAASA